MKQIKKIIYKKSYYDFYPITESNIYSYMKTKYALYYPKYFKNEILLICSPYRIIPIEATNIFSVCDYYEVCVQRINARENIYDIFSDFDKQILYQFSGMGEASKEVKRVYLEGNHLFIWFTNELLRRYRFKIPLNQ